MLGISVSCIFWVPRVYVACISHIPFEGNTYILLVHQPPTTWQIVGARIKTDYLSGQNDVEQFGSLGFFKKTVSVCHVSTAIGTIE